MRVLIADRNARLLEAIARTFAQQFTIHTAASHEQCNELLRRGAFDLVVVSEKLADGLGLQLLGRVARDSPDTLRVFAAGRSRLHLLKGKLGPFGLFRTLAYPINPQELLSLLTLARAGLEIGASAGVTRDVLVAEAQGGTVPPAQGNAALPLEAPPLSAPAAAPGVAEQRAAVERISLTSGDAAFAVDVPKMIAATKRRRRPKSASVPPQAPSVRQPSGAAVGVERAPARATDSKVPRPRAPTPVEHGAAPPPPSAASQAQKAVSVARRSAPEPAHTRHPAPTPASPQATAASFSPRIPPHRAAPQHRSPRREVVQASPTRSRLMLGAAIAVVFLATTLTLNLLDGGVHVTRASTPSPEIKRPAIYTSPPPEPRAVAPVFGPTPRVAHHVDPKPTAPKSDADPTDPQVAAANTPIADPSTFGSEAYEPIYPN